MITPDPEGLRVRQQLQRRRRQTGENFQQLLERYVLERFLYRLGNSRHRSSLVLKGAVLFTAWLDVPHRPTRDVDLAGMLPMDIDEARSIITEICELDPANDEGIRFDVAAMTAEPIREQASYGGIRIILPATLTGARLRLQVDIGLGDAITPRPTATQLPALTDHPAPRVLAYPRETVVAEKLETLVQLGRVNSRMKDYFDLHALALHFDFDGPTLTTALRSTFERRRTQLPDSTPDGLSDDFARDPVKQQQWRAFLNRIGQPDASLPAAINEIHRFALPPLMAASQRCPIPTRWTHSQGWHDDPSEAGDT